MVKTLVVAEFAMGIPELDLAREKAHAFARRFLKRARGLIFEIAALLRSISRSSVLLVICLLFGCGGYGNRDETEKRLLAENALAREYFESFPSCEYGISHFTGEYGGSEFHATYAWPDGWRIELRFMVRVDHRRNRAEAIGPARLNVQPPVGPSPWWNPPPDSRVTIEDLKRFRETKDRTVLGIPTK
jgi:hypothetical protein